MLNAEVAIIGGGLSGLYAASLLAQKGIRYIVLEARPVLGGRILSHTAAVVATRHDSVTSAKAQERFDMGATWLWPSMQPHVGRLVDELRLQTFPQPVEGDWLLERSRMEQPARVPGYTSAAPSVRLAGGMASMVDALQAKLAADRIRTSCEVTSVELVDGLVHLETTGKGASSSLWVERVLLALPPRLAVETITFSPALPPDISRAWSNTPTWMAPHAKYLAVFDKPFWRAEGLAGAAQSSIGPMVEIHDASSERGAAALFGFIGLPAQGRSDISEDELIRACRLQLSRLFGSQARRPVSEVLQDWARERFTATQHDLVASGHARAPKTAVSQGPWDSRLYGAASEWSIDFPGYIAGAIDAAERSVNALLGQTVSLQP